MNKVQVENMEHALKNGNRFYTDSNSKNWNELVEKGLNILVGKKIQHILD